MNYFISSNLNYFQVSYPFVVKSLLESGIEPKNIYMIVGGCEDATCNLNFDNYLGINIFYVNYNSFDMTALIYAAENLGKIKAHHIFLLHDTCLAGKNFKNFSCQYSVETKLKKIYNSISMNIGLYSLKSLKENKELIINLKKFPKSYQETQICKLFFVENEDIIFNTYKTESYSIYIKKNLEETVASFNKYYHGFIERLSDKRQILFSPGLDFYKFQANFLMTKDWIINL